MEKELIAEKRKSSSENEQNIKDIQKLQKDFREIQSELEIKNLKVTNLDLECRNNREELKKLKWDNQELEQKNTHLQVLWENQAPEMEEQKQQISSLQKLNRKLSQYIHDNQFTASYTHKQKQEINITQEENTISDVLKNIHIHNKDI